MLVSHPTSLSSLALIIRSNLAQSFSALLTITLETAKFVNPSPTTLITILDMSSNTKIYLLSIISIR